MGLGKGGRGAGVDHETATCWEKQLAAGTASVAFVLCASVSFSVKWDRECVSHELRNVKCPEQRPLVNHAGIAALIPPAHAEWESLP